MTRASERKWEGPRDFDDTIVCPYCNAEDGETSEYPDSLMHDGDRVAHNCSSCGRDYTVIMCATYTFASEPIERLATVEGVVVTHRAHERCHHCAGVNAHEATHCVHCGCPMAEPLGSEPKP